MAKARHTPVRTCVACRQEGDKAQLVRLVRRPDGLVVADPSGRLPGRGAYLHATLECIATARKKRSLDRALGAAVTPAVWTEIAP